MTLRFRSQFLHSCCVDVDPYCGGSSLANVSVAVRSTILELCTIWCMCVHASYMKMTRGTNLMQQFASWYLSSFSVPFLWYAALSLRYHPYQLMVTWDGGDVPTPIKTDSHCELLRRTNFPVLPLHINLSTVQCLSDRHVRHLVHVRPTTSAASYPEIKLLVNATVACYVS